MWWDDLNWIEIYNELEWIGENMPLFHRHLSKQFWDYYDKKFGAVLHNYTFTAPMTEECYYTVGNTTVRWQGE